MNFDSYFRIIPPKLNVEMFCQNPYNSIQENPARKHGDELNADMSSSGTKGNPGHEAVRGCHGVCDGSCEGFTF